jgi:ATP-dependent helicase/nuclease subunit A
VGEAGRLAAVEAVRTREAARARAESYRLLYVAMTRARDRLYVTGFESRKARGRDTGCWYDVVRDALSDAAEMVPRENGEEILRLAHSGTGPITPEALPAIAPPAPLPEWARAPAPREATPDALRPSAKQTPASAGPAGGGADIARRRGEIIHLLLERLPDVPAEARAAEAERLVAAQQAESTDTEGARALADEALRIVNAPEFSHLFAAGSRAEVPIAADLTGQETAGQLSGRIDRLVVRADDILVIDYKTDAHVPATPDLAPEGYAAQLDAYCRALAGIFPDKQVRAFILWTSAPALMEILRRAVEGLSTRT